MKAASARSSGERTRSPPPSIRSRRARPRTAAGGRPRSRSRWARTGDPASTRWRSPRARRRADAFFVVRPRADRSPILLVLSTATYNAYNDWGGPSLYTGGTRVSFERPFARGFLTKPEPAVRKAETVPDQRGARLLHLGRGAWALSLERRCGMVDMGTTFRRVGRAGGLRDRRGRLAGSRDASRGARRASALPLGRARRVLVLGHARRRRGVHRPMAATPRSSAGTPVGGRSGSEEGGTMICFKYRADDDPVVGSDEQRFLTGSWSDRRIGRAENSMTGLSFSRGGYSRYGVGRPTGERRLHGLATRSLGVHRDGSSLRGRARPDRCHRRLRGRRMRPDDGGWTPGADARGRSARHARGAGDGSRPPVVARRAAVAVREGARRARTRGGGIVG